MDEVARFGFRAEQSGQSVAAFCRERGLRVWHFFDWKKRLGEGEVAKFVAVEVKPAEYGGDHRLCQAIRRLRFVCGRSQSCS